MSYGKALTVESRPWIRHPTERTSNICTGLQHIVYNSPFATEFLLTASY
jgi:hypothetical protein